MRADLETSKERLVTPVECTSLDLRRRPGLAYTHGNHRCLELCALVLDDTSIFCSGLFLPTLVWLCLCLMQRPEIKWKSRPFRCNSVCMPLAPRDGKNGSLGIGWSRREAGETLKTDGIRLREGAGLERCYEDEKCGEIFDGTRLLPSLSSFKKVLPCMVQKIWDII